MAPASILTSESFKIDLTLKSNGFIPLSKELLEILIVLVGAKIALSLSSSRIVIDLVTTSSPIDVKLLLMILIEGMSIDKELEPFAASAKTTLSPLSNTKLTFEMHME